MTHLLNKFTKLQNITKFLIFIFFIFVLLSIISNVNGASIAINSTNDTIQNAHNALPTNESNIIYMKNGNYSGIGNYNIAINRNITLIGESRENTIINANYLGRVFNINGAFNLSLINLTLINGCANNVD